MVLNTTETTYSTKDKQWLLKMLRECGKHFRMRFEQAQIISEPFDHLWIDEVFTEEFCDWVDWLYTIIPEEYFKDIKNSTYISDQYPAGRNCFHLSPYRQRPGTLDSHLLKTKVPDDTHRLHFRSLIMFMEMYVRPMIIKKFNLDPNVPGKELLMLEDKTGYYIGAHTDVDDKVVSSLFYMPPCEEIEGAGTVVLKPKEGILVNPDKACSTTFFDRVYRPPFKRNSLFSFRRSDVSWHSVDEHKAGEPRRILMFVLRAMKN